MFTKKHFERNIVSGRTCSWGVKGVDEVVWDQAAVPVGAAAAAGAVAGAVGAVG